MLKQKLMGSTGVEPIFVEDVMSTYLYTGNGSTQTITNGIDLAGEGGMTWMKVRSTSDDHILYDTVRGVYNGLRPSRTDGTYNISPDGLSAFNSNGFTLNGAITNFNASGQTYASWTFRKQPKFFDVVTYTGNGAAIRNIPHSLGIRPGMIIWKRLDSAGDWIARHRTMTGSSLGFLKLNTTDSALSITGLGYGDASVFNVSSSAQNTTTNINGVTYVAYLFAHNAGGFGLTGTDNVISCGSYTGNGSTSGPVIDLGYEPQWVMIKRTSDVSNWGMFDNMRGIPTGSGDAELRANSSAAENSESGNQLDLTATGFQLKETFSGINANGSTYIYIAIRRGPMKVPTTGTSVFAPALGQSPNPNYVSGFPVDFAMSEYRVNGSNSTGSRLQGSNVMDTASTGSENSDGSVAWDFMNGYYINGRTTDFVSWMWRRAPGFFDEVCYTGDGDTGYRPIKHNLGAPADLAIVKRRSASADWAVGYWDATAGASRFLLLNSTAAATTGTATNGFVSPYWDTSEFAVSGNGASTVNNVNASGSAYVAYLFATCPGVSKVTNFTGNGSSQTINCGFTSGARFVMIKATSTTGNWTVFDSARGISAGGDPALYLNSTAAEVTGIDAIDPDSTGFVVNQEGTFNLNATGVQYLVLAIS